MNKRIQKKLAKRWGFRKFRKRYPFRWAEVEGSIFADPRLRVPSAHIAHLFDSYPIDIEGHLKLLESLKPRTVEIQFPNPARGYVIRSDS